MTLSGHPNEHHHLDHLQQNHRGVSRGYRLEWVSTSMSCVRNSDVRRLETFARNDKDFSSSSEVTRRWTFLIWKNKNSIFLTLRYIKSTIICYRCSTSIWLLFFCCCSVFFLVYTIVKMYPFKNNAKTKSTEKNSKTIPLINYKKKTERKTKRPKHNH